MFIIIKETGLAILQIAIFNFKCLILNRSVMILLCSLVA